MAGMAVGEIIGLYGQEGYRQLEQDALLQVSDGHDHVMMAAAGGVVEDAETYDMLLSRFHTVGCAPPLTIICGVLESKATNGPWRVTPLLWNS